MSDAVQLTEREVKLLANAMQCLPSAPQIDLGKLASLSGYTNVGSARNAWTALIKKIGLKSTTTNGGGGSSAPLTPKSSARKHAPAGGTGAAETTASPAAQRAKRKAQQAGLADDDHDEHEAQRPEADAGKTKLPAAPVKKSGTPKTKTLSKTASATAVKREPSPENAADDGEDEAPRSGPDPDHVTTKVAPTSAAKKGSSAATTKAKTPKAKAVKRVGSPEPASAADKGARGTSAPTGKRAASVERGRRSTRDGAEDEHDGATDGGAAAHVDVGEGEDEYVFSS